MYDRLKIVYEDQWLIVADKPAGLLSMSTGKREGETTAYSILTDHFGKIFIVHRLDRETSGLIVFAKDQDTKLSLQEHWNEAVLERGYTAVLEGRRQGHRSCKGGQMPLCRQKRMEIRIQPLQKDGICRIRREHIHIC